MRVTIKHLVILLGLLSATASFADDGSILYWMLDVEPTSDYQYVQLRQVGDGLLNFTDDRGIVLTDIAEVAKDPGVDHYYSDFSGVSEGNFFLELMDGELAIIGTSQEVKYSDLTSYLYDPSSTKPPAPYSGWTISPVPEPTSGLMVLLGTALLALRRKRA